MQRLRDLVARKGINPFEPVAGGVACVALPTLVRLALTEPLGTALPFATYFPAVLVSVMLWGWRWGLAVLVASGVAASVLFVDSSAFLSGSKGLAALALFSTCGALILLTGHELRQALIALQAAKLAESARKSELQHRLKNTLTVVQSFSFYLSRKAADVEDFHRSLEARIGALAKASKVLFAEEFENCSLPETAQAALAPSSGDNRMTLSGPHLRLDALCCEPLVLALHELATNSHKYGALTAHTGHVHLSWSTSSREPLCTLRWVESGGPIVRAPVRSGLGQRLLARQRGLEAVALSYEATGLVCEIIVPLAARRPIAPAMDAATNSSASSVGSVA